MKKKIYRYILLFFSSIFLCVSTFAQSHKHNVELSADTLPLIMGKQIFANMAGVVLWQFSDYGEIEGGIKANIKGRFFPTLEAGIGLCDKTNDETDIHYKTSSPFVRIGCDYNFARKYTSSNKILGGLRLGYSSFKYDIDAPAIEDPYWNHSQLDFNFKGVKSNAMWAEFLFGLETKVWKRLNIGWTARYKRRLHHKTSNTGKAWYIPGYGENDGHLFTATFNVIIDI